MSPAQQFSTDWLGTHPVFFNRKTKKVSHHIHDVIEYGSIQFHPEGLKNYLDFGYSVFGQTPIQDVEFLLPNSTLQIKLGELHISTQEINIDSTELLSEFEIFEYLEQGILQWGKQQSKIILPMSGGYDSRLLAYFAHSLPQVSTFTYGLAEPQSSSHEVVHAFEIAQKLSLDWHFVPLGNFLRFIPDWFSLFGPAVHAHGMYQMEFYHKIIKQHPGGSVLSGIFGDVWAGNGQYTTLHTAEDLLKLSYSHGLHADSSSLLLTTTDEIRNSFWEANKTQLQEEKYQIIQLIRLKMMLISYLLKVPEKLGFSTCAPYLDPKIALSMINLSPKRRTQRLWQKEYLQQHGLLVENSGLPKSYQNWLNHLALRIHPLPELSIDLLSKYFHKSYLNWINTNVNATPIAKIQQQLLHIDKAASLFHVLKIPDRQMKAYSAYLTLKPLEMVLRKNEGLI